MRERETETERERDETETERETERDRETEREIGPQRQRERQRQRDRQKEGERDRDRQRQTERQTETLPHVDTATLLWDLRQSAEPAFSVLEIRYLSNAVLSFDPKQLTDRAIIWQEQKEGRGTGCLSLRPRSM